MIFVVVAVSRTQGAGTAVKVETTAFTTPLGNVMVDVHDGGGSKTVVMVHGMNSALVREWSGIAAFLAARGFRVLLVDMHSNPQTKPGTISHDDFATVMLALAGGRRAIWCGKSWGGAEVAEFAARHPKAAEKVVLVAPAIPNAQISATCERLNSPLLLLWAEDDPVMPVKNGVLMKQTCAHASLHTTPQGGHRIITEVYAAIINAFLQRE